jgi:hypothetical protein
MMTATDCAAPALKAELDKKMELAKRNQAGA